MRLYFALARIGAVTARPAEIAGQVLILLIGFVAFVSVILRYIFGISYAWADEICRFGTVAVCLVCAGVLLRVGGHIKLELLRFQGKAKYIQSLIIHIVGLVFACLATYWGIEWVKLTAQLGAMSDSCVFPLAFIYALVPLGMGIYALYSLMEVIKAAAALYSRRLDEIDSRVKQMADKDIW